MLVAAVEAYHEEHKILVQSWLSNVDQMAGGLQVEVIFEKSSKIFGKEARH